MKSGPVAVDRLRQEADDSTADLVGNKVAGPQKRAMLSWANGKKM